VVEDVVGVVRGLHVHQPVVDGVAVRLADSLGAFVTTEEVDVDAFAKAAEGGKEPLHPSGVPVVEVLTGPPHTIEGDRVRGLPVPERRPALGDSAHRPLQMEHGHVRSWRRAGERVLGDHVDKVIAELGKMGGLPVVVPTVQDGRVKRALKLHVSRGPDDVEEGSPGCAERAEHLLTVRDRPGIAGTDHHHRTPVQILRDARDRRRGAEPHDRGEFVGGIAHEVAVDAEDFPSVARVPEDGAGQDRGSDGVEAELERGDHAEVTAAAS
jgi:hypothetical protein